MIWTKAHTQPPNFYGDVGLPTVTSDELKEIVLNEMFYEAYTPPEKLARLSDEVAERRRDLNARIENAWVVRNGTQFRYRSPVSTFAKGGPGHGKTSATAAALKEFSDSCGLNFVSREEFNNDYQPKPNDVLLIPLELAGEQSALMLGGFPMKSSDDERQAYMKKVLERRLVVANEAAFSMLLLDDVSNAAPSIQNAALGVIEERAVQGNPLGHIAVTLTGNLGKKDGASIARSSTPLISRTQSVLTYDTVRDFIKRLEQRSQQGPWATNDVGGSMVKGFLIRNPESFSEDPGKKVSAYNESSFAAPRTWDKLVESLRGIVDTYVTKERLGKLDLTNPDDYAVIEEYTKDLLKSKNVTSKQVHALYSTHSTNVDNELAKLRKDIQIRVGAIIGTRESGVEFADYVNRRLVYGTDALAESLLKQGELSQRQQADFIAKYKGQSVEAKDFGHHMVMSMAESAAPMLADAISKGDHKAIEAVSQRFAKGMYAPATRKSDTGKNFAYSLDESEANRAYHFLIASAHRKLGDGKGIKSTEHGYIVEQSILQSIIRGTGKEPAAHITMEHGRESSKRINMLLDMLTHNTDAASDFSIDEIKSLLEQANNEQQMDGADLTAVAEQSEDDILAKNAAAHQQSEPEPDLQKSAESSSFDADLDELDFDIPSKSNTETPAASPTEKSAFDDPFDFDGLDDLNLNENNAASPKLPDPQSSLMPEDFTLEIEQDGEQPTNKTKNERKAEDDVDLSFDDFEIPVGQGR